MQQKNGNRELDESNTLRYFFLIVIVVTRDSKKLIRHTLKLSLKNCVLDLEGWENMVADRLAWCSQISADTVPYEIFRI